MNTLLAIFVEFNVVFMICALYESDTGVFSNDICCFPDRSFVVII